MATKSSIGKTELLLHAKTVPVVKYCGQSSAGAGRPRDGRSYFRHSAADAEESVTASSIHRPGRPQKEHSPRCPGDVKSRGGTASIAPTWRYYEGCQQHTHSRACLTYRRVALL